MCNLGELRISNSHLESFRDLGGSLAQSLEILSTQKCELVDLDGIDSFNQLTNLSLAHNKIEDVSYLGALQLLHTLVSSLFHFPSMGAPFKRCLIERIGV